MLLDQVKEIVADNLGVDVDEITEESSLQDDLNADSLDAIQIINDLEDELDIELDLDDEGSFEGLNTVGDIVKFIQETQGND